MLNFILGFITFPILSASIASIIVYIERKTAQKALLKAFNNGGNANG